MEYLKFFIASYISYFDFDENDDVQSTVSSQGIWAHTSEEVLGRLMADPEYADARPLDANGVIIVCISEKLAQEILVKGDPAELMS